MLTALYRKIPKDLAYNNEIIIKINNYNVDIYEFME